MLENESATEPKEDAQGQVTAYSHSNTANKIESTWHEGKIFEKDSRLLSSLEVSSPSALQPLYLCLSSPPNFFFKILADASLELTN